MFENISMKGKVNAWIGSSAGVKFILRTFMLINNRTYVTVIKDKEKQNIQALNDSPNYYGNESANFCTP